MQTNTLDPNSKFFKQLQDLLSPDPDAPKSPLPFVLTQESFSKSSGLDLQHIVDASPSPLDVEPEGFPSSQVGITTSDLFRSLYAPSGKWKWMLGHNMVDQNSTFLSAGAMCSASYRTGKIANRELNYISKSWKTNMHWDNAFYSELALYKKQLKPLQGKCVPDVIGVFTGPGVLNVAMDPPHSSFWIEASTDMPVPLKQRCLDAFAEIHSRGVFHGDVELRHMLIGGDTKVTIIDFQASAALEPNERVLLLPATEADLRKEMRKVKVKLDYPGSRMYEQEKKERCLKRSRHNADEIRKTTLNPSYTPQIEEESEDDTLNPPVLDRQEWEDWIAIPESPRLFIVPGQSLQQRTDAYEAFLALLAVPSQIAADPMPPLFDKKPDEGPSASPVIQENRVMSFPDFPLLSSDPFASEPGLSSKLGLGERSKHRATYPDLANSFPQIFAQDLPGRYSSQSSIDDRILQSPDDSLSSRDKLVSKRPTPFPNETIRPIKRARLIDDASDSSVPLAVPQAGTSSDVSDRLGLGKYEWLPNFRYPSRPTPRNAQDQETWARVAMESLGQCALQELPHPDLIKLYPHHPRWADDDVQVFLGRLQRTEQEMAWAALQHPNRKFSGPRHPRSVGNLKRKLDEIQHELQHSAAEALIRGQKRPRREESEADEDKAVLANEVMQGQDVQRKVRFAPLDRGKESSTLPTPVIMPPSTQASSWIGRPLSLIAQVFSWI